MAGVSPAFALSAGPSVLVPAAPVPPGTSGISGSSNLSKSPSQQPLSTVAAAAGGAWLLSLAAARSCRAQRRAGRASIARPAVVFIDGEAGTTGLQVRERLEAHPDIEILSLPSDKRKEESARQEALRSADAAVLCLPDDAAVAAVQLVGDADTVIVDASTAHRVSDGWVYGFPELTADHKAKIASSKRIANPGCYPTGFISLVRPLVDAGLVPADATLTVPAISGYSGGGKGLIEVYEGPSHEPWGAYGFGLDHKHLPEMAKYTGLNEEPLFCPAVGGFKQGMVVSVPMRMSQLTPGTTLSDVQRVLAERYAGSQFVSVADELNPQGVLERGAFLRPDTVNDTNRLELFCFGNEEKGSLWLLARLDNLGKGASGACVQNLNLALGLDEGAGLGE